eukprot:1160915-Pelagomonas_calceolata.AAC.16
MVPNGGPAAPRTSQTGPHCWCPHVQWQRYHNRTGHTCMEKRHRDTSSPAALLTSDAGGPPLLVPACPAARLALPTQASHQQSNECNA